jgi:hypothetical protein
MKDSAPTLLAWVPKKFELLLKADPVCAGKLGSRNRVWKAWTERDELMQWFGPKGFKMTTAKPDFRPGGIFHLSLYARKLPQAANPALDGRGHQLNNDLSEVAADIERQNLTNAHELISSVWDS